MNGKILSSVGNIVLVDVDPSDDNSKINVNDIRNGKYKIYYRKNYVGEIFNIIGRVDKPYFVGRIDKKLKLINLKDKSIEIVKESIKYNKKIYKKKNHKENKKEYKIKDGNENKEEDKK